MEKVLRNIKKIIPPPLFHAIQPPYHFTMAFLGALLYRFPSRQIVVIGATGTKGKTTVTEIVNAILEEGGKKTALANTIRFKIGEDSKPNLFKMTMPGRFFLQRFLRGALNEGCGYAILEMTSEGAKQFRHKWIYLDALIFTNITPEHIEAHGSFENYLRAKLALTDSLVSSPKNNKAAIANTDDKHGAKFLDIEIENKISYSLKDAEPYILKENGANVTIDGALITLPLIGVFNIYNALAATATARHFGIPFEVIKRALEKPRIIPGRVEYINEGQAFDVILDYAHTPDSQRALYEAFDGRKRICVLGNTGGGRDKWKRSIMGRIAESHCEHVILTNEDPYDEDPRAIVDEMASGMKKKPKIIMDRRKAIRKALALAEKSDVVLITGKGTDPYIMGPNGTKEPWSDALVTREELASFIKHQA